MMVVSPCTSSSRTMSLSGGSTAVVGNKLWSFVSASGRGDHGGTVVVCLAWWAGLGVSKQCIFPEE